MKRLLAQILIAATMASVAQLSALPAYAGPPETAAAGIREGLVGVGAPATGGLAQWLADMADHEELGEPLPMTGLAPGGPSGVDLATLWDHANFGSNLTSTTSLSDLAAQISGITEAGPDRDVVASATVVNPPAGSDVYGLDISFRATREVADAPLKISSTTPLVDVTSPSSSVGLPIRLTYTANFNVRYDVDQDYFWLVTTTGSTPTITLDAEVDRDFSDADPDAFDFTGSPFTSAVGIGDVTVKPTESSLALEETLTVSLTDSDADGAMAFMEPSGDGVTQVPAELTLPQSQNVAVSPAGSGSATLGLLSPYIASGADPDAEVTIPTFLLPAGPVVTVNAGFATLGQFQNVSSTDLLGGVGQLVALLRAVQSREATDKTLPFIDARLSELVDVGDGLADLVLDLSRPDDPLTIENEFGQAEFATIGGFLDSLDGIDGINAAAISPRFDPATDQLRFTLSVDTALTSATPVHVPTPPTTDAPVPAGPDTPERKAGGVNLADDLKPFTKIGSLSTDPTVTPPATKQTEYTLALDFGVNLRDAAPCTGTALPDTSCDIDATEAFLEVDNLPVYNRFFVDTGNDPDPEITLSTLVTTPVANTIGRAGFFDVFVMPTGSSLSVGKADATKPTETINIKVPTRAELTPASPADPTGVTADPTSIQQLLREVGLTGTSSPTADPTDDELSAVFNMSATGTLNIDVRSDIPRDDDPATEASGYTAPYATNGYSLLGDNLAVIGVSWPNTATPLVQSNFTLDAEAELLKLLDYDTDNPLAAFGKLLDGFDNVVSELEDFSTANTGVAGFFNENLPLLGRTAGDLFTQFDTLHAELEEIRNNVAQESAQSLEGRVRSGLGIAPGSSFLRLGLKNLDTDGDADLVLKLRAEDTLDEQVPLGFDLSLGGNEVTVGGLEGTGNLNVRGTSLLQLDFPLELSSTAPGAPKILDTSKLEITANVDNADDASITGRIAGLEMALGPNADLKVQAGFRAANTGTSAPDESMSVASFLSGLSATQIDLPTLDCGTPPDPDDGPDETDPDPDDGPTEPTAIRGKLFCVRAPMFIQSDKTTPALEPVGTSADHYDNLLTWSSDDFTSIGSPSLPPGLDYNDILTALIPLGMFGDGIAKLKELLAKALQAASFDGQLPFLGDDLSAASDLVNKFEPVKTAFDAIQDPSDVTPTVADFRTSVLNPVAQAILDTKLLLDSNYPSDAGSGTPSIGDVYFQIFCGSGPCAESSHTVADVTKVTADFALGEADPSNAAGCTTAACVKSIPFDLGLDGLGIVGLTGSLNAEFGWRVQVGVGVSQADGFFVKENPIRYDTGAADSGDAVPEVVVGTSVTPGSGIDAYLGFLKVRIDDTVVNSPATSDDDAANHVSELSGTIEANLNNPNGSGSDDIIRLTDIPGLLGRLPDTLAPKVNLNADVDLKLAVQPNFGSGTDGLPKLQTNLLIDWGLVFDVGADENAFQTSEPTLALENVGIDLGSVVGSTLKPIFTKINDFTEPIEPIREVIFSPVPVLSQAAELFGQEPVTWVDLAAMFGEFDPSLLEDINDLLELIETLASDSSDDGAFFPLTSGVVSLEGARAKDSKPTAGEEAEIFGGTLPAVGSIKSGVAGSNAAGAAVSSADTDDFDFPFLDDPSCFLGMLFGGDCDLVEWNPEPFSLDFQFEIPIGPFFGVLYVTFGGFAGAKMQIGLGFSTRGIRLLGTKLANGDATAVSFLGPVLDGIYLSDTYPGVAGDPNEFEVNAGITVGAELNIGIAAAGARGGIEARVGLNLHDGPTLDGKVYVDEVLAKILTPLCLFDIEGALEAFLEVYVEIGPCPFCVEKSFELARVKLLDFTIIADCPDAPPELATATGNVLYLHVGDEPGTTYNATDRGAGWGGVTNEQFVVRQIDADTVTVTALGYTQTYEPVSSVVIQNAGSDHDVFTFAGSKQDTDDKAAQDPNASGEFSLPVTANLGVGNDNITTGGGNDNVTGGPSTTSSEDNDNITLGSGADRAAGGAGNDSIFGGFGADPALDGGNGDDTIDGGPAGDTINGDDGNDKLDGGRDVKDNAGVIVTNGADGVDTISGGFDNDLIHGGPAGDTIRGDSASDTGTTAGTEAGTPDPSDDDYDEEDEIYGEGGVDTIHAGPGSDSAVDNAYDVALDEQLGCGDSVFGDADGDFIYGMGGIDCIFGGTGEDDIYGGPGGDQVRGGDDGDLIYGNADEDTLHGELHADDIHGGSENDEILGNAGADDILGGLGSDTVFGGGDDDVVVGDDGPLDFSTRAVSFDKNTTVGAGDTIYGDGGADKLHGQGGVDTIRGGSENDLIYGNGGDDKLFGDNENDELHGNVGTDTIEGNNGDDLGYGEEDDDTLYGQAGADRLIGGHATSGTSDAGDFVHGGTGNDVGIGDNGTISVSLAVTLEPVPCVAGTYGNDYLTGGTENDILHGQCGDDDIFGGDGQDQLFGELHSDDMFGQLGEDYLLGDQGTVTLTSGSFPGGAPKATVALVSANDGGIDRMWGGTDDDHMYGGAAGDVMRGDTGDDYMEGNGGQDSMYGLDETIDDGVAQDSDLHSQALALLDSDEDDLLGGSSPVNPEAIDLDVGETVMQGNLRQDVMTGDNATVAGVESNGAWAVDPVTLGRARTVTLLDTEKTGGHLAAVSGDDFMLGNAANDRMYGEGGNDAMRGNTEDDFIEGNQGTDLAEGNQGEDDILGGSSLIVGTTSGKPNGINDENDFLFGGGSADVLTGDNAVIVRDTSIATPYYTTTRIPSELSATRRIDLLDLRNPDFATNSGPDQIAGGQGSDTVFGQDDTEKIFGGTEDDYMEGNGATDYLYGDRDLSPTLPATAPAFLVAHISTDPEQLFGPAGQAGQDDQIGGSNIAAHRDANDHIYGDGAADFQLGDNGTLVRTIVGAAYLRYVEYNPTTIVRASTRWDVGAPAAQQVWGGDYFEGNDGDDYQWGQDGNDEMYGNAQNDDMYGELGDDRMFGGDHEDAMVGDRGLITDTLVAGNSRMVTSDTQGPAFFVYEGLRDGQLDRRVDLLADGDGDTDGDGNPVESPGLTVGGMDFMRGGPDHDSMHGAFGDDIMNGDSGGDWVFGADGADVLYSGKGKDVSGLDPTANERTDPTSKYFDSYVDYLFGGHGGSTADTGNRYGIAEGADVLDYRPRGTYAGCGPKVVTGGDRKVDTSQDPCDWFLITDTHDVDVTNNQHHQGIDWIYGGQNRDILQADVGKNGPDFGDRLLDWVGAYNLYTRCNASYGDDGDIRQHTPAVEAFLQALAYGSGAGKSLADVQTPGTSGYRELAFVFAGDKSNNGKAFPTTPGHFDNPSCQA
ncbi:MAG TPA: calcium-binding protein [Mycobacteriales bacterium]|nr:calcium-binding protein [Mycobacteriales bacterium]